MGRHNAPDHDEPTVPILRLPARRGMRSQERSVAGVAFPIVDDLSLIASDDRLLDSLAAGRTEFDDLFVLPAPASSGYADRSHPGNVRGVAPLLALWRAHVVDPPMPTLPALAVPRRVMRAPADRRRSLRPMLAAGAAICALLMGSTAVGAQSARPGDALWGLTQVLYSDRALSVEALVKVNNLVTEANRALDHGDTVKAGWLLTSARGEVARVLPTDGKANLERDVNGLQIKLQTKQSSADQPSPGDRPTEAGSSPGRVLNAVAPATVGIAATLSSSSPIPPAGSPVAAAAAAAAATAGSGNPTSVASNPILEPPPVPTVPPTLLLTSPVASVAGPSTGPVTVASSTSPVPVDPITTPAATSGPSVTDSTTSVVIAPTTTTPSATDPVTTSSTDPAITNTSTTSVMPTPSPTDTTSSVTDVSGAVGAPTSTSP